MLLRRIKPIVRQYYVGKNNNIIEINGNRYDARTGVLLSSHAHESNNHVPKEPQAVELKSTSKSKTMHDVVRQPAKKAETHKPKPSKTLMRHAVKKPVPGQTKPKIKAQGPNDITFKDPLAAVEIKKSANNVDHKKLAKAARVPKSHLIAHFGKITSDINSPNPSPNPMPKQPAQAPKAPSAPKSKPKTTAELLDHAVMQANSHEQPANKTKKPRKHRRMALASMTAVILLSFVGYQELPKLQFNLAAAKAGFGASLPTYQPAGYSVGELNYSPGVIATKFNSNSDQRTYTLTQKTSTWNSQALKENFVLHKTDKFQVVETAGQTIFLYGNGSATWVNGGVWYIIQSNGSLNEQQLVDIAKSL